jgi:hypothetical protein
MSLRRLSGAAAGASRHLIRRFPAGAAPCHDRRAMKLYTTDKTELMEVSAIERDGDALLIKGKIFGTMPMTARLTPAEARRGFKLLDWRLALFLLSFLFRRSG